jgi:chitinase
MRNWKAYGTALPAVVACALGLAACLDDKSGDLTKRSEDLLTGPCAGLPDWGEGQSYAQGALVQYGGHAYKCIQAHTAITGWTPAAVPALWQETSDCGGSNGGSTSSSSGGSQGGCTGGMPDSGGGNGNGNGNGNGGGPLKGHVLTGYWQNFNNGATVLTLAQVPQAYNLIAVAFADADPGHPGGITFTLDPGLGGYTADQFKADIQTLHVQGRKVILSVGGQNGTISVGDDSSAGNFANSVHSAMQEYGFDGVDIDLENGINPTAMGSALHKLAGLAGQNLIVTLAPQTIDMQSTGSGYFQLALAIKDILTIANMQYYNSGSMLGADQKVYSQGSVDFLTALAAIQLQGGLRPDQVGLGLPASPQGAGSGYVSPSVVNAALDCLASGTNCGSFKPGQTYPGIRGAMDWSINWDASNGYSFANTIAPHFGSVP